MTISIMLTNHGSYFTDPDAEDGIMEAYDVSFTLPDERVIYCYVTQGSGGYVSLPIRVFDDETWIACAGCELFRTKETVGINIVKVT